MLDDVDRGLVHALHIDGRAPFARIAEVLGVSTQTVTRRYQRLRREAGLRVVGLTTPGQTADSRWMVRLTAAPATAGDIARSLARRPDTSWVRLTSGGTEIVAVVTAPMAGGSWPALVLHDIPRTASISTVSAHALLHTYLGGPTTWPGRTQALDHAQQDRLSRPAPVVECAPERVELNPSEQRMLAVLTRDGRAAYGELAAATGWSAATAARRLSDLRDRGVIFFDVEIDDTHLGVATRTMLWLSVAPADLDATARAIAGHAEVAFVAAITGTYNLAAQVLSSGPAALHGYLTGPLADLGAIRAIETTPVLQTLKAL
ncbi:Lrp/AsnC family transcriptional regulator [Pseudonocardia cypriaca]|uniref:DNA-binding Lrp family transcriptional regulator n=1 Tax=Pseudonocardia cypriaca TaxID=882449 RepID=A0A543FQ88_9PSEU|nr:AsnC family transcriptional regulator [Pseudonocardia cypriaca]TQM35977.1 DNA-binding Lrp family transcriptional regulator [Pseudonocardia cypriaca]